MMTAKTGQSGKDNVMNEKMDTQAADKSAERAADKAALEAEADAILAEAGESETETKEGGEGFADPVAFLSAELDKLEAEKSEMKDQALRLAAEMENLRRRTAKDVKDAREYSIAGFAKEMLAVSDNLRRAIEAVPQEARDAGDAGLMALLEGVEMTERAMMQGLEKYGVRKMSPLNERFDPNMHQAMFEVPNPDMPNNTVVQVVQDGYAIGERCLRPAMVGVSKGGPKQSAASNGANEPEEDKVEN